MPPGERKRGMTNPPDSDTRGDLHDIIAVYKGIHTGLLNTLGDATWPHIQALIDSMERDAISILSACGHERDLRWALGEHNMELIIRDANRLRTEDSLVNAVMRAKTKIENPKGAGEPEHTHHAELPNRHERIIFIWNANIHDGDTWVHLLNLISGTTFKICLVVPEDCLVETVRIHSGRISRYYYKPDMANVIQNILSQLSQYNFYIDRLHEASRKAWTESRNAVDFIMEITEVINYHMWDNPNH